MTAGATAGAGEALNLGQTSGVGTPTNPTGSLTSSSLKIGQHATQIAVNSTVGAGVETVINGNGFDEFGENWVDRAKTGAVMAIGSEISSEIGNAYKDGDINKGVQLIAHAALGCGVGAATASDCSAGAAGGVAGEIAGGLYKNSIADDLGADIKNGTLTADKLREYQQNGVDIAKLSGAIAAAMTGADSEGIYAGAGTGQNAAENNAVQALALAAEAIVILGAAGITIAATDKALNGEISNAELGQQFLTAVEIGAKNSYTMGWMFSDGEEGGDNLPQIGHNGGPPLDEEPNNNNNNKPPRDPMKRPLHNTLNPA